MDSLLQAAADGVLQRFLVARAETRFDVAKKTARRKQQFPLDCQRAFELGARLAGGA